MVELLPRTPRSEAMDRSTRRGGDDGQPQLWNLSALPVVIPSHPEQIAIAGLLAALDDKIEVNQRLVELSDRHLQRTLQAEIAAGVDATVAACLVHQWTSFTKGALVPAAWL